MTNETMLTIRKFVSLKHTKQNPLTHWTGATWRYDFRILEPLACLSTWTVLIKYNEDIFTLKTKDSWKWTMLPATLHSQLSGSWATLARWTTSDEDRKFLLGPNPPSTLPAIQSTEWKPTEEEADRSEDEGEEGQLIHSTYEE